MAGSRENVTANHTYRTQSYVKVLAEKLRKHPRFSSFLDNEDIIDVLSKTAILHDIGSVGIPDRIYLKLGPLTSDEFEIMKTHTTKGVKFYP
jgi:putative two-component system response regulator